MKNIKSLLYAAVAVLLLPLASCSDDDYERVPVPAGQEVYFSESLATTQKITRGTSSIEIPVMRIKTEEAETVQLMSEDESGLFTIPGSVTFAAGESTSKVTISYRFEDLSYGTDYNVSLLIMGNSSEWGQSQVHLTLSVPEPWTKLGTGLFRDDVIASAFNGVEPRETEVDIYEYDGREGYYYLDSPYSAVFLAPLFGVDPSELGSGNIRATQFIIDATDPDAVVIGSAAAPQDCGCLLGSDGWISIFSDAPGTLEDGIITFPVDGIRVCFSEHAGQSFAVNSNGAFRVVLPGVTVLDCSIAAAYDGMKTAANGSTSALFNLAFGADVESYKYVIAEGDVTDDLATVVAGIADGSIENVAEGSIENSSIAVALEESGMHSFIAVPYSGGEAQTNDAVIVVFFFPGSNGGDIPDIDIVLELGYAEEYLKPEAAAQYPSTSNLVFYLEATDVKSIKYYINKTSVLANFGEEEYPDIVAAYGVDGASMLDPLKQNGYYLGLFSNREAGTSYTLLMLVESIYGKTYLVSATKSTTAVEYTGELVLGTYTITDGEGDNQSAASFTLSPTEDPNTFIVRNFLLNNGSAFMAAYDSSAATLTLNGIEQGYEDDGNIFGKIYGWFNKDKDWVYAYLSSATEDYATNNSPVVFGIDAATKQIKTLKTYLSCSVFVQTSQQYIGDALAFTPQSVIALDNGTAAASAKTAVSGFTKNFRYLQTPVMLVRGIEAVSGDKCTKLNMERGLRTVKVQAEPCARQTKSNLTTKFAKRF